MTILTVVGVFAPALLIVLYKASVPEPIPDVEGDSVVRRSVRLFSWFPYWLLLALVIIVGIGLSGLLASVIPGGPVTAGTEPSGVALWLSFVFAGGPALFAVARWVRRSLDSPGEPTPRGWPPYLNVATLMGLILGGESAAEMAWGVLGVVEFNPHSLARSVVWGAVWFIHYRIAERYGHTGHLRLGVLIGALAGLALLASGALRGLGHFLLGWINQAAGRAALLSELGDQMFRALVEIVIGGAIWARYWFFAGLRFEKDTLWHGYVVLVGVLGSLLIALTAVGVLAASVLDWFLGEGSDPAAVHFAEAPWSLSFLIVAGALWAYHRAVVRTEPVAIGSEVDRFHDYAAAGAGLLATVSGVVGVIAVLIQVLTSAEITRPWGGATLFNALALLLVGVPVWWRYWSMAQNHRAAQPETKVRSPTRRIYRFFMIALVFIPGLFVAREFLTGLTGGDLASTLYNVRVEVGLMAAAGAAMALRWTTIRDRGLAVKRKEVVRSVTLVGSASKDLAHTVAERTDMKVHHFKRPDIEAGFSPSQVIAAIESAGRDQLLILARPEGPEVIPMPKGYSHFVPAEVPDGLAVVTLVGSANQDLAHTVAERTGVELWIFERPDVDVGFSPDEVIAAIASAGHEHLLILARPQGPEVIPLPPYAAGDFLLSFLDP